MTCERDDTAPATIRAEALADLISDVVITCTGGTPAAAGAPVPEYEILAISNAPLAVRVVTPAPPKLPIDLDAPPPPTLLWTDALLVLDEASPERQIPCVPAGRALSCAALGGSTSAPNVFQGKRLQDNIVVFQKVPIDAPGPGRKRVIRVTNLRANATKIPKLPLPLQVTLSTQIFDSSGRVMSLRNADQVAGIPRESIEATLRTASDGAVSSLLPALTVTPSMLPQSNPGRNTAFHIKFTERFASAFKRRNLGTSSLDPNFVVSQAQAGSSNFTESGFFNSRFPSENELNKAGLADSGTRLKVVFTDIPENVFIVVSAREVAVGTTGYVESSPRALLTYTSDGGSGPFTQNNPESENFSKLFPFNGTVTAVWEIVSADPNKIEELSFEVRLLAPNGVPRVGTGMIHAGLGPVHVVAADAATPLPSFTEDLSDPVPAFRLVPTLSVGSITNVSAASYSAASMAPESIVSAFGANLAGATQVSGAAPVSTMGGIKVDVIDNTGTRRAAPLFMISPTQINFLLNPGTAMGAAIVNVMSGDQSIATGYLQVAPVAPGLFSANGTGRGVAVGQATQLTGSATRSVDLARYDQQQQLWQPVPVDLGSADTLTFLTIYGTGIRGRSGLAAATLSVGGEPVPLTFAGPQGQFSGLDQINAGPLPRSLANRGEVPLILTVDGKGSNSITISVR